MRPDVWSSLVHWLKSLWSKSSKSWFATRLLGCWDLKARINLNQFRSSRWPLALSPLTMTKTYKTKEQRALQTDSICADLCWHQNYFQINKPLKLKTLKKEETTMEQQNTTTQHNHSSESAVLLSLIPYAKVPSPCCGSPRPMFHP